MNNIRKNTIKRLKDHDIDVNIILPDIDINSLRNAKDIGIRIMQLYALIGVSVPKVDPLKIKSFLEKEKAYNSLEGKEKQLFEGHEDSISRIDLSWMRESLYALCWAANIIGEFSFPDRQINGELMEKILKLIPPGVSSDDFLKNLSLRSKEVIYAEADFYYCLDWSAASYGDKVVAPGRVNVDHGVVLERRRALEWLIGNDSWWKVSMDT